MSTTETSLNNKKDELRTHHYRNDYLACKEVIQKVIKSFGYYDFRADDTFQEILVESDSFETIFKITEINPIQSSIDIFVTKKSLFKKSNAHIVLLYEALDKSLQYNGKGEQ